MLFPDLYGNRLLKQRLSLILGHDRAGHCYILSGPEGSGKHTLARIMAAALECTGSGDHPCGVCPHCHKALNGIHPDISVIDSDKATVPVDLIRSMRADAFVLPNEGQRKIYIIPRAQDMQDAAQNALLKILEEPPSYCTFLLLTDSADKLLTTVRSRAVELSMSPLSDSELHAALKKLRPDAYDAALVYAVEHAEGYIGPGLKLIDQGTTEEDPNLSALIASYLKSDELSILELLVPMEKHDRRALLEFTSALYEVFIKAFRYQKGGSTSAAPDVKALSGLPAAQLVSVIENLQHVITILQANGNVGGCVGLLLTTFTA